MSISDRKEAIRAYKERVPSRGIFVVRCEKAGLAWVDMAPDLGTIRNRVWSELRNNGMRNPPMQAAWNQWGGEEAFTFEVLETLDPDTPEMNLRDILKARRIEWAKKLGAATIYP